MTRFNPSSHVRLSRDLFRWTVIVVACASVPVAVLQDTVAGTAAEFRISRGGLALGALVWIAALTGLDRVLQRRGMVEVSRVLRGGATGLALAQAVLALIAAPLVAILYVPSVWFMSPFMNFVGGGTPTEFWGATVFTALAGTGAFVSSLAIGIVMYRPGLRS